eukprot:gene13592-biopygen9578
MGAPPPTLRPLEALLPGDCRDHRPPNSEAGSLPVVRSGFQRLPLVPRGLLCRFQVRFSGLWRLRFLPTPRARNAQAGAPWSGYPVVRAHGEGIPHSRPKACFPIVWRVPLWRLRFLPTPRARNAQAGAPWSGYPVVRAHGEGIPHSRPKVCFPIVWRVPLWRLRFLPTPRAQNAQAGAPWSGYPVVRAHGEGVPHSRPEVCFPIMWRVPAGVVQSCSPVPRRARGLPPDFRAAALCGRPRWSGALRPRPPSGPRGRMAPAGLPGSTPPHLRSRATGVGGRGCPS